MKTIGILVAKLQRFRRFRILVANLYPMLTKLKIIKLLQRINKGSISDPYDHEKNQNAGLINTYDIDINKLGPIESYNVDFRKFVSLYKDYTFGFLTKPNDYDLNNIRNACNILGVKVIIFNIKDPNLYYKIAKSDLDGIFIYPVFENDLIRNLFHEAVQILCSETKLRIYPSIRELNIYESKRTLADFLAINDIPHPKTSVFYDYGSAKEFLKTAEYPLVFKTHVGASASGVEILRNKKEALKLARNLFFRYYLRKLEVEKRAIEWGYMLLQEYIEDAKEFRIIKVGDSWFGYQKWKNENQEFFSGSGVCKMIDPPEDLLNFCRNISVKHDFTTMSFDIFENKKGNYLVNELQTWFGSYDPTEMYVDNTPGRYINLNGKWAFEPGFFNIHGSMLLRLIHFISILQQS